MKQINSYRNTGLDVIRCIAVFCVIGVHFFLNTGFYNEPVVGVPMLLMTIMRSCFMICVPLFMMLTGYLINTKKPSTAYYKKIIRIIFVYVLASFLCALYKKYILKNGISYLGIVVNMFSFDNAPYSWYIEMYIGFFLLIPFLNILYDAIDTKKNKKILIATLFVLTVLPSVFNIYCISGLDWWLKPSSQTNNFPFVPDWWQDIYPITYFYLGKYLKEFPFTMKTSKKIIITLFLFLFSGMYNYYRSYGSTFLWGAWQSYYSILVTTQTFLIFSIFSSLNYSSLPPSVKSLFATVSDLSLGVYLTSWILDQIIYGYLNQFVTIIAQKLFYFLPVVFAVFLGSLFLSAAINRLYTAFLLIRVKS